MGKRMRDDLHKTVPLARPWGRVLRCLSKERWTTNELALLIVTTVQKVAKLGDDAGGRNLAEALTDDCGDLFDDGENNMRLTLLRIQDQTLSLSARSTCEMALGVLSTHGLTGDFRKQVIQATGTQHAREEIEHMAARVAEMHGLFEASQVRATLLAALRLCDFTKIAGPISRKQKSVPEMLSTELSLQVAHA